MRVDRSTLGTAVVAALVAGALAWVLFRRPPPLPDSPEATAPPRAPASKPETTPSLVFGPEAIGLPAAEGTLPLVTNVQIVDLDQDGLADILYCEAAAHTVRWIRQSPRGVFTDQVIGENLRAPAHVWAADVNGSGRRDVLVACMGQLMPTNDRIGAVVVLENVDNHRFQPRPLLERTARVTDVRAANLAGHTDGRLDLIAGQFGYAQGEVRWLENRGGWNFESRVVSTLSGCVHVPTADFDGDGRTDFAALISQEWEEVHLFRHTTTTGLTSAVIWGSTNEDFGSSGLAVADLNRDGRPDLIYTNGDGFDYPVPGGRPWHGFQWLENTGHGRFTYRRVGDMPGAYSPQAADLDNDGDVDLLAVSCFADWSNPEAVSMQAWVNDGRQNFVPVVLARAPTHLVTAAVGDLDGDGVPEIVTGGLYIFPPFPNPQSVTLWRRR